MHVSKQIIALCNCSALKIAIDLGSPHLSLNVEESFPRNTNKHMALFIVFTLLSFLFGTFSPPFRVTEHHSV